jgi:hypothetical protein
MPQIGLQKEKLKWIEPSKSERKESNLKVLERQKEELRARLVRLQLIQHMIDKNLKLKEDMLKILEDMVNQMEGELLSSHHLHSMISFPKNVHMDMEQIEMIHKEHKILIENQIRINMEVLPSILMTLIAKMILVVKKINREMFNKGINRLRIITISVNLELDKEINNQGIMNNRNHKKSLRWKFLNFLEVLKMMVLLGIQTSKATRMMLHSQDQ